jgi:hypothetical protein
VLLFDTSLSMEPVVEHIAQQVLLRSANCALAIAWP